MNHFNIPSAFDILRKEAIEKKETAQNIIGYRKTNIQYGGLYGSDFSFDFPDIKLDTTDKIHCIYENCSFSCTTGMMDVHIKMVHEAGLGDRFTLIMDGIAWIEERKKNFPMSKAKQEQLGLERNKFGDNQKANNKSKYQRSNDVVTHSQNVFSSYSDDPLSSILQKCIKIPTVSTELTSLMAVYESGSEAEEGEIIETDYSLINPNFAGLPLPKDMPEKLRRTKRNRFRLPILPQMNLMTKRWKIMNPKRRYLETRMRKVKRPRLADFLLADELESERNFVLQYLRYAVNKRFFDDHLKSNSDGFKPTENDCKPLTNEDEDSEKSDKNDNDATIDYNSDVDETVEWNKIFNEDFIWSE